MPKLIRLYIKSVAIGFGLAALFVALLVWQDVGQLRRLVLADGSGWIAVLMLVVFHGVVFAGAQFAIAVMRLAAPEDGPSGGRPRRVQPEPVPVPVRATHPLRRRR